MAGLDGDSLKRAKRSREGVIKGSGNAIVPWLAAAFVEASVEAIGLRPWQCERCGWVELSADEPPPYECADMECPFEWTPVEAPRRPQKAPDGERVR